MTGWREKLRGLIRAWRADGGVSRDIHADEFAEELEEALAGIIEWQPIETAPEGQWVLAFRADSHWPEAVEETMWIAIKQPYGWSICLDGQSCKPTHWMPLPEPPDGSPSTTR